MSLTFLYQLTAVVTLTVIPTALWADGQQLFKQCQGCHAVGPDANNLFGPQLNGVLDRPMASASGYTYSDAFTAAVADGLVWTHETLSAYLESPMTMMPGTKMAFPGVADAEQRNDLIDYLAAINSAGEGSDNSEAIKTEAPVQTSLTLEQAAATVIPEHGVYHLGRVASETEVAAWDIDVRPDGLGLPKGSGDALTGAEIYDAQCALCHGDFGEGAGRWPVLAGGQDTLTDERPEKTIGSYWPYLSTVYDYIYRAMPFGNARSLSADDVYALTAYLLYLNDLADEDFELNHENLAQFRLPNESGFFDDDRLSESHHRDNTEPCMTDCKPSAVEVTQRARVLDVTPEEDATGDASGDGHSDTM